MGVEVQRPLCGPVPTLEPQCSRGPLMLPSRPLSLFPLAGSAPPPSGIPCPFVPAHALSSGLQRNVLACLITIIYHLMIFPLFVIFIIILAHFLISALMIIAYGTGPASPRPRVRSCGPSSEVKARGQVSCPGHRQPRLPSRMRSPSSGPLSTHLPLEHFPAWFPHCCAA